jgi:hypothetical protein
LGKLDEMIVTKCAQSKESERFKIFDAESCDRGQMDHHKTQLVCPLYHSSVEMNGAVKIRGAEFDVHAVENGTGDFYKIGRRCERESLVLFAWWIAT